MCPLAICNRYGNTKLLFLNLWHQAIIKDFLVTNIRVNCTCVGEANATMSIGCYTVATSKMAFGLMHKMAKGNAWRDKIKDGKHVVESYASLQPWFLSQCGCGQGYAEQMRWAVLTEGKIFLSTTSLLY